MPIEGPGFDKQVETVENLVQVKGEFPVLSIEVLQCFDSHAELGTLSHVKEELTRLSEKGLRLEGESSEGVCSSMKLPRVIRGDEDWSRGSLVMEILLVASLGLESVESQSVESLEMESPSEIFSSQTYIHMCI